MKRGGDQHHQENGPAGPAASPSRRPRGASPGPLAPCRLGSLDVVDEDVLERRQDPLDREAGSRTSARGARSAPASMASGRRRGSGFRRRTSRSPRLLADRLEASPTRGAVTSSTASPAKTRFSSRPCPGPRGARVDEASGGSTRPRRVVVVTKTSPVRRHLVDQPPEAAARDRVDAARGLVEEDDARPVHHAQASASRCFQAPGSSPVSRLFLPSSPPCGRPQASRSRPPRRGGRRRPRRSGGSGDRQVV